MKFIHIVVTFKAMYLAVDVYSASLVYSVSNDKLTQGHCWREMDIPIKEVWDSLSTSKKNWSDNIF